jgi:hypothetical protein
MKRTLVVLFLTFALAGVLQAHEGMHHILGKVTAVAENSITVETAGKESKVVTVSVSSQTKFEKDGKPASLKDLAVGERVVVHAKENKDKKFEAAVVIFGKPAPKKQ